MVCLSYYLNEEYRTTFPALSIHNSGQYVNQFTPLARRPVGIDAKGVNHKRRNYQRVRDATGGGYSLGHADVHLNLNDTAPGSQHIFIADPPAC